MASRPHRGTPAYRLADLASGPAHLIRSDAVAHRRWRRSRRERRCRRQWSRPVFCTIPSRTPSFCRPARRRRAARSRRGRPDRCQHCGTPVRPRCFPVVPWRSRRSASRSVYLQAWPTRRAAQQFVRGAPANPGPIDQLSGGRTRRSCTDDGSGVDVSQWYYGRLNLPNFGGTRRPNPVVNVEHHRGGAVPTAAARIVTAVTASRAPTPALAVAPHWSPDDAIRITS